MPRESRPLRRTRIIATIGPACRSTASLDAMVEAGVDVFRINCSHAGAGEIESDVARVRGAAARAGRAAAILLDLQGPRIRTGPAEAPLRLRAGDLLELVMAELPASGRRMGVTWPDLAREVHPGDELLFADGSLSGCVERVLPDSDPPQVHVRMGSGGLLGAHKGINVPGVPIHAPSLTPKDLEDLATGVRAGVDYVALSFARSAADLIGLRRRLDEHGSAELPVIAKIERPEALEHVDEILSTADGIMVARGDLGVELPLETVPIHQKRLIRAANRAGVLVITATQMLDSMEHNPRPTRAEATDVANAILDGTDALMLSGETAIGEHPVEAVRVMDRIAHETEQSPFFHAPAPDELPVAASGSQALALATAFAVAGTSRPLVVFTWSGYSAILASKSRPRGPIFALTPSATVRDRLCLAWGVTSIQVPVVQSTEELIAIGEDVLLRGGYLRAGEEVVVLAGTTPMRGATNLMKVHTVGVD